MTRFFRFLLATTLLLSFSFSAAARADEEGLNCGLIPTLTTYFLRYHVSIHSATDEINHRTVEQMIKRIDPSKVILLASDVEMLKPKILGVLKNMQNKIDCAPIDEIKALMVSRTKEQLAFAKESMGPKYKLDESVELQLEADKREFPKDIEESHKRQVIQMHFQISNYLMTDMKLPKAKEQLIHRYELNVKRMEELKPSDLYNYLVNSFASALDPHSNYLSPEDTEDFRINMQLSLEGIGASLSPEDGYTVIQELIKGGAAEKSKLLLPKDKIIAVGQGKDSPMENVIDMDLKDVVRKIRGKAGTTVRLTILREKPDVQRFNLSLVRSKVELEDDAAKIDFQDRTVNGKKFRLARIELPSFYGGQRRGDRSCSRDMQIAVEKAAKGKADGILIDLSSNSGGLLDEAVKIGGLFINRGNIVATKDSTAEIQMLDDVDSRVQFDGPVVVLISRLSASAAEIVAGALQDYKRAVIVGGDHTYGKGSVQAVLPLKPEYGVIKVTTGLFFIPGGNSTQWKGVASDVPFPNPFSTDDFGEKHLDYSLKPESIPTFLSPESNEAHLWTPVAKSEIDELKKLSAERVAKSKDFAEIVKDNKEIDDRKGVIKLSDMRKKEGEQKKKNKDKAPKQIAKERNKVQIDEALNILGDFVSLRKNGSGKLITTEKPH
ncbi:MAG: S41 family peptidase [Bacteriovoracia bacterium]